MKRNNFKVANLFVEKSHLRTKLNNLPKRSPNIFSAENSRKAKKYTVQAEVVCNSVHIG
jgi:hypothetical protein